MTGKAIDSCPKCPGQMNEVEAIPSAKELTEQLDQPGAYLKSSALSRILTQRFLRRLELLRQHLDRIDSS